LGPQSAPAPLASADAAVAMSDLDREVATALASKEPVPVEQLYNLGVRLYRANRLADAKSLFDTAATRAKADLASRSMYNRGTAAYAESLESMRAAGEESGETQANPQELQQKVMQQLEQALRSLKDAARADPTNADARANAELAHRVLKELKKQQQEQKQDQQQQQQDQQQKQDHQQQQDQQQKQDQQQPQPRDSAQGKQEERPLTKQEVERLLQKIRDKEKQRLKERLARERARTQPAPKDW